MLWEEPPNALVGALSRVVVTSVGHADGTTMRISLADLDQVPDLLTFLRRGGCIAYATDECQVIEVLGPDGVAKHEPFEIRTLVDAWRAVNPTALVRLEPR